MSQTKSKAQRRREAQERAAERRAAEQRAKRQRTALRTGGIVVLVGAVVAIIVVTTSGSNSPSIPPQLKHPHVPTQAIPASMKASWIQPPSAPAGPETVPIPSGAKLADLSNGASGQGVDGVQCNAGEQTVTHVHTHLTIFVNGKARVVPYGIGIPGFSAVSTPQGPFVQTGSCFYWLHTHANDGIIHVESPSTSESFTLKQFFDEWGQTLNSNQVGSATGKVTAFFDGKLYTGNLANLPLGYHYQIQLDVGTPIVAPVNLKTWGQL